MVKKRTRTEKDSLGEIEVPLDALYGAQTQRAIDNFQISELQMPRSFIQALALVKYAAASANSELGLLDEGRATAIAGAALDIVAGNHLDAFPIDVFQTGSGTSSNMNANEVIASLANRTSGVSVHANDHVNMSQSSNDVIPTVLHVSACMNIRGELLPALDNLAGVIEKRADLSRHIVKTGRTHLMDAMPLTLGQEMSGWAAQVRYAIERLEDGLKRLQQLALGGTAVGTGVNAPQGFAVAAVAHLSIKTGIEFSLKPNLFEGLSAQDSAVEMSGHLNTIAVSLTKIANDLRWMNSGPLAGLAEISLKALQPGSSVMPGKVNPVVPEAVLMAMAQVIGHHTAITVAGQSGNFQLNVTLPLIAYNLIQSIALLAGSARQLADTVTDFTVNEASLNESLEKNPILVTALNRIIGYDKGSSIAKRAYAEGRPILEVAMQETDVDEATLRELLDPRKLT